MRSYSVWTIQTSCPCFFYEKSYWHLKSRALFLSLKVDWHLRATEGLVFSPFLLNWSFHKSVQGEKTGYILQMWLSRWKYEKVTCDILNTLLTLNTSYILCPAKRKEKKWENKEKEQNMSSFLVLIFKAPALSKRFPNWNWNILRQVGQFTKTNIALPIAIARLIDQCYPNPHRAMQWCSWVVSHSFNRSTQTCSSYHWFKSTLIHAGRSGTETGFVYGMLIPPIYPLLIVPLQHPIPASFPSALNVPDLTGLLMNAGTSRCILPTGVSEPYSVVTCLKILLWQLATAEFRLSPSTHSAV